MATIPCWVSIPMFMMTTNRLKEVSISSNHSVCHFLPLFEPPRRPKWSKSKFMATILWWLVSILMFLMTTDRLNVVSIVSNYSVCHFYHFFSTFWTTAELKINEIQIYGYHTLLGVKSYVFDDDISIKSGCKIIKLSGVSLLTTFGPLRKSKFTANIPYHYQALRCRRSEEPIRISEGPILSQMAMLGTQMALPGDITVVQAYQIALSAIRLPWDGPIKLSDRSSKLSEGPIRLSEGPIRVSGSQSTVV